MLKLPYVKSAAFCITYVAFIKHTSIGSYSRCPGSESIVSYSVQNVCVCVCVDYIL